MKDNLLLRAAKEKKREFLLSTILAAIASLLAIVPLALIYYIVQYYLEAGVGASAEPVLKMIGYGIIAVALSYLLTVSSFVFSHIAAFDLLYRIRARLIRHIGTLPMGFWTKNNSGRVRKVIQEDVELIENFVAHHLPDIVSGLVLPVATLAFLFYIDWRMALAASIPLLIGMVLIKMMWGGAWTGQNRQELMRQWHNSQEEMHSTTVEYAQGMPVVKVFNLTIDSFKRLKESVLAYRKFNLSVAKSTTPFWAMFTAIVLGGGIFILPVGLYLLQIGQTDVPTLILFLLLGTGCFSKFVGLITIMGHLGIIFEGGNRIDAILKESPLSEPAHPKLPVRYDIELKDVGFRYRDDGSEVLEGINAILPEGSFTAIVGPSGAGKTTMTNLIARFWDAQSGTICIGDVPIEKLYPDKLLSRVAMVFQDVYLFNDTVANNIRVGKHDATDEEVREAARLAQCNEFIENLPQGYDTLVSEEGKSLSGGERQRISIARAILKDAPIILLDEATASLDPENESEIQKALENLVQEKTLVVIAHRFKSIQNADQILVLKDGQIYERGTHDSLVETGGLYQHLWEEQQKAGGWKMRGGWMLLSLSKKK